MDVSRVSTLSLLSSTSRQADDLGAEQPLIGLAVQLQPLEQRPDAVV